MKKILSLLVVLIFANSVYSQNQPNDCVNAITVCGNGTFSSNADGIGSIQEISGSCSSFEHNTIWLRINIVQSGTLGFDIIPNDTDINVDYDFWIFGANRPCNSLGSPIRCNTTNPALAGLPDNHTGLNHINTSTTAGPGANGNGYVYRLDVIAGQFYYIAIDRPHGDGGFEIRWNGTAMNGLGAFPTPPTANQIPDLITCSSLPNSGIFPLYSVRSQINSDLTNNTITFHATYANAVDGVSPLPDIYGNVSNPQRIYARVTNNVGKCFTITEFNLRVVQLPTATISLSRTQVCTGENVTVTFTGSPGVTVEYRINGGAIQTVILDSAGSYQLTETVTANRTYSLVSAKVLNSSNAIVCSQNLNETETVTVNPLPTISGNLSICVNGTSQLTGSGTPAAVSPWTSSNTGVATVNGTGLVTAVGVGTSVITYMDSNGCSNTTTVTVNALPTVTGTATICANATTQLTGSGTPASVNPWVSSNTAIATVNAGGLVSGVAAGTVTIIYTDANGCSASMPITIDPIPTISGTTSLCQNATTQLTGSGTPATSNAWTSSNPAVATVTAIGLVTGLSGGTSTITYTSNGGCSATTVVTINALPTISGSLSGCIGTSSQLIGTGTPAVISPWASSNPAVATVSASGMVTSLSAGTTTITYNDANGCSNTVVFTVNALPVVSGTNTICVNGITQFTGSGSSAASNAWTTSNAAVAVVTPTGLVTGISAGTTTITFTDSNGCSNTRNVTVNALPTINGTLSVCEGATTQLTGSPAPAAVNPWVSSNTAVATVNATGLVSAIATGTTLITYTNTNGCTIIATVVVNALPVISGRLNACVGTTSQLTGSGTPAASSPWSSSNNGIASVSNNGLVTAFAPGTVTITYTNNNGCVTTSSFTVITTPIVSVNNVTVCTGDLATVTATPGVAGIYTYVWTVPTGVANPGNVASFTTSVAGTYSVVISSGTCSSLSASGTVSNYAVPTISGSATLCDGSTTQLTGSGTPAAVNPWASSDTSVATVSNTGLVSGVAAGNAVITYTTVNGCTATTSVTVNPIITPTFNFSTTYCSGVTPSPLTTTSLEGITGTWSPAFNNMANGTYTFTPTAGQCAVAPAPVNIQIIQAPLLTVTNNAPTLCDGESVNISISSTVPSATFAWTASASNINASYPASGDETTINQAVHLINPLISGSITFSIASSSANGCPGDIKQVTVIINPVPTITSNVVVDTDLCTGETVNIDVTGTPSGTVFNWVVLNASNAQVQGGVTSGTSTSGDINLVLIATSATTSGTIQFEITPVRNGCTGTPVQTAIVTVNPTPGTPIPTPIYEICSGESTNIVVNAFPIITGTALEWEVVNVTNVIGATSGTGAVGIPIVQQLFNTTNQIGYVTYRVKSVLGGCYGASTDYRVRVNPLPTVTLTGGTICIDANGDAFTSLVLDTGLNDTDYLFSWTLNGNPIAGSSSVLVDETDELGDYSVIITNITTGCTSQPATATVVGHNVGTSVVLTTSIAFQDSGTISATVVGGSGDYLYSLDGGEWQESNVFTNVLPGEHEVTVTDIYGCTQLSANTFLINYPHFFTPNGDGYNDTWNIWDISDQANAEIHIFDRYGKLIKQITPAGGGWDGTFNGQVMPSTDYWFTLKFVDPTTQTEREFKAHFSMKR
ncbi:Ig-like domain-containing protein [Flavobacterium pedocola]